MWLLGVPPDLLPGVPVCHRVGVTAYCCKHQCQRAGAPPGSPNPAAGQGPVPPDGGSGGPTRGHPPLRCDLGVKPAAQERAAAGPPSPNPTAHLAGVGKGNGTWRSTLIRAPIFARTANTIDPRVLALSPAPLWRWA